MEACEFFVLHKFFAFPIVDEQRRVVGLVDVGLFTEEVFDIAEREQMTEVFETLGFHVAQVREASPWRAFRIRFPWLVTTIISGTFCAVLAGFYKLTLAKSLVIAFFLTMILGLGESVSIQSMTVTIQSAADEPADAALVSGVAAARNRSPRCCWGRVRVGSGIVVLDLAARANARAGHRRERHVLPADGVRRRA